MSSPTDPQAAELPRARAQARYVRITPMKARRVIDLVRGRSAADALAILRFQPQAAAETVAKVVASAVANAENNDGLNPDALIIDKAYVDEGPTLKRYRPRAQGRPGQIRKRSSHITIELVEVPVADGDRKSGRARRAAGSSAKGRTR